MKSLIHETWCDVSITGDVSIPMDMVANPKLLQLFYLY